MEMNMEILEEFWGSNDQNLHKGKRTKRPRLSYSTTSSGGGSGGEFWSVISSSPSTSSGISASTEEDEDMANCLILLARGGAFQPEEIKSPGKLSSRKFTEMETATAKVGMYDVYECKTCNRAFPSFQALGGHRASHFVKKPKLTAEDDRRKFSPPVCDDQEEEAEEKKFTRMNHLMPPSAADQVPIVKSFHHESKSKVHECSICGSEFASGQALGGHMRRHRSAPNTTSSHEAAGKPAKSLLSLDLNLPAPPEDDRREASLNQFTANQQPRIVFSAAPLVDCLY